MTKSFVTTYKEQFGDMPNQFAADAYDAIYIIRAVIEKAGVTPDMGTADMGTALKAAMTEITVDGLTGQGMTWQAEGTVNKTPHAVKIVDGAYQAM
ncbi:MAG: ABC transporter substrate-binding protein, partial [Acetivibrio ethanolgignens]